MLEGPLDSSGHCVVLTALAPERIHSDAATKFHSDRDIRRCHQAGLFRPRNSVIAGLLTTSWRRGSRELETALGSCATGNYLSCQARYKCDGLRGNARPGTSKATLECDRRRCGKRRRVIRAGAGPSYASRAVTKESVPAVSRRAPGPCRTCRRGKKER